MLSNAPRALTINHRSLIYVDAVNSQIFLSRYLTWRTSLIEMASFRSKRCVVNTLVSVSLNAVQLKMIPEKMIKIMFVKLGKIGVHLPFREKSGVWVHFGDLLVSLGETYMYLQ